MAITKVTLDEELADARLLVEKVVAEGEPTTASL